MNKREIWISFKEDLKVLQKFLPCSMVNKRHVPPAALFEILLYVHTVWKLPSIYCLVVTDGKWIRAHICVWRDLQAALEAFYNHLVLFCSVTFPLLIKQKSEALQSIEGERNISVYWYSKVQDRKSWISTTVRVISHTTFCKFYLPAGLEFRNWKYKVGFFEVYSQIPPWFSGTLRTQQLLMRFMLTKATSVYLLSRCHLFQDTILNNRLGVTL